VGQLGQTKKRNWEDSHTQFAVAQGVMLVLPLVLGVIATRKFHPTPTA
jgi:hypothetical protein